MRRLAIIFIWILAQCTLAIGQFEPTKIDEFGKVNCDEFLARADNFFVALNNNPAARGFFVIYGNDHHKGTPLAYSNLLDDAVAARQYDPSRVEIVHAPSSQGVGASFWLAPPGASIPTSWSSEWDFALSPKDKAFIWSSGFAEMCASPPNVALLTRYLEANPGSRVHVVIHAANQRNRRTGLVEAKAALDGIPSNRIRYFYRKLAGYVIPINEYWFVPKKQR